MTDSYNELTPISLFFMSILFVWSLSWIVLSVVKIKQNVANKIYWLVNFFWSLVNISIASMSIFTTLGIENYSLERTTSMRNIVLVNVFLGIIYIVVAIILKRSSNDTKKQIGSAVLVQGMFLLIFDILIVVVFQSIING